MGGAAKRYLEEKYSVNTQPRLGAADYDNRYEQYRKNQANIIKYSATESESERPFVDGYSRRKDNQHYQRYRDNQEPYAAHNGRDQPASRYPPSASKDAVHFPTTPTPQAPYQNLRGPAYSGQDSPAKRVDTVGDSSPTKFSRPRY